MTGIEGNLGGVEIKKNTVQMKSEKSTVFSQVSYTSRSSSYVN